MRTSYRFVNPAREAGACGNGTPIAISPRRVQIGIGAARFAMRREIQMNWPLWAGR